MTTSDPRDLEHVQGTAIAALLLTTTTLRLLRDTGRVKQDELDNLFGIVLSSLGKWNLSEPAAEAARQTVSSLALALGAPKQQH